MRARADSSIAAARDAGGSRRLDTRRLRRALHPQRFRRAGVGKHAGLAAHGIAAGQSALHPSARNVSTTPHLELPQSDEAERSVLGAILVDGQYLDQVSDMLRP